MDMSTIETANNLVRALREVDAELSAWGKVTRQEKLGMRVNDDFFTQLPYKHSPKQAFEAYRDSCINALKVRRAEVEAEIAAL